MKDQELTEHDKELQRQCVKKADRWIKAHGLDNRMDTQVGATLHAVRVLREAIASQTSGHLVPNIINHSSSFFSELCLGTEVLQMILDVEIGDYANRQNMLTMMIVAEAVSKFLVKNEEISKLFDDDLLQQLDHTSERIVKMVHEDMLQEPQGNG